MPIFPVVFWFFLMGNLNAARVGPFSSERDCQEYRAKMERQIPNVFSPCYSVGTAAIIIPDKERAMPNRPVYNLIPWHYEALRMHLMGFKPQAIAKAVHHHDEEVKWLLKQPLALEALREMHDRNLSTLAQVQTEIQAMAPRALARLREDLDMADPELNGDITDLDRKLAQKAYLWILEASGHTPIRRLEVRKFTRREDALENLSEEELRRLALEKIKPGAIEVVMRKEAVPVAAIEGPELEDETK